MPGYPVDAEDAQWGWGMPCYSWGWGMTNFSMGVGDAGLLNGDVITWRMPRGNGGFSEAEGRGVLHRIARLRASRVPASLLY